VAAAGTPTSAPAVAGLCATANDYFWTISTQESGLDIHVAEYRAGWEASDWLQAPLEEIDGGGWQAVIATSRDAGTTLTARWLDAPDLVASGSNPNTTACQAATYSLTIDAQGGSAAATDFDVPLISEDPNPPYAARETTHPVPDTALTIQPGAYIVGSRPPAVPAGYVWLSTWCVTNTDAGGTTDPDYPRLVLGVVPGDTVSCTASYHYGPALTDGIAEGKNATSGFASTGITIPQGTWVTYRVSTRPNMAGKSLEIWRKTGASWAKIATRAVGSDGTVRYSAAVSKTAVFQARWPGDAELPASNAPAKTVTVSARGEARISAACDDFYDAMGEDGTSAITRHVWVKSGQNVTVSLCENASTGYAWSTPHYPAGAIKLVSHRIVAPTSGLLGAPGTAIWVFKALKPATSTISFSYDQPWSGGAKGTWKLSVVVHALK
jgi:predicted secreted protein